MALLVSSGIFAPVRAREADQWATKQAVASRASSSRARAEAEALTIKAKRANGMDESASAIDFATAAIARDGQFAAAYLERARSHRELGHQSAAFADLASALPLTSGAEREGVLFERVKLFMSLKRYNEAVSDLDLRWKKHPDEENLPSLRFRSQCYLELGKPQLAVENRQGRSSFLPTREICLFCVPGHTAKLMTCRRLWPIITN